MRKTERQAMYLPFVASILSLKAESWGLLWRDVLHKVAFNYRAKPVGAICRATKTDGQFSVRALTSEEANNMLLEYVGMKKIDKNCPSSHGFKATTLQWCARYGVSDRSRTLLGHRSLKENSLACYSRDLLSLPLREL